ncbi:MAG: hypothetical protein WBW61_07925 [Rhodanobacteraceae bacterium]
MGLMFSICAVIGGFMLFSAGLAVLPALLVLAAVGIGLWITFALLGIVLRLVGGIMLLFFAIPMMFALGAVALTFGLALVPLILPLLLIAGVIWLLTRAGRSAPQAQPAPNPGT